jgi:hypothetical protein
MLSQSDQYGGRSGGVVGSVTSKLPSSESMHPQVYRQIDNLPTPLNCRTDSNLELHFSAMLGREQAVEEVLT